MSDKNAKFRELIASVGLEEKDYPGGAFEGVEIVEAEMVWNLYFSFATVVGIEALRLLEERIVARFKAPEIKAVTVFYAFREKTVSAALLEKYYDHILTACCAERPRFEALRVSTPFSNRTRSPSTPRPKAKRICSGVSSRA